MSFAKARSTRWDLGSSRKRSDDGTDLSKRSRSESYRNPRGKIEDSKLYDEDPK